MEHYLLNQIVLPKELGLNPKKICDFLCIGFHDLEEARRIYPDGEFIRINIEEEENEE